MRAVVVHEFGPIDSHEVEEVAAPEPGADQILIDVHAIGVNFPDTLMVQGLYQTKPELPFVPGRDAVGVVARVGDKVTRFKPGDHVAAQAKWGGYAEQVAVPETRAFAMPDGMDFIAAAAMGSVYPTVHVSLMNRAHYRPGETVLVLGAAGGIGLAAVQVAKAKGALVIAGAHSEDKRQLALESGADHAIDLSVDDLRENLRHQVFAVTDGRGADIIFDPVGGDVFDAALRALAFEGRLLTIGYASGRIPAAKANYFNVKNLSLVGVAFELYFGRAPEIVDRAIADLYDMYAKGLIKPEVMATYPLDQFKTAMNLFGERKTRGRVVLTTGVGG
jgi:NADPH2:quinone reductase